MVTAVVAAHLREVSANPVDARVAMIRHLSVAGSWLSAKDCTLSADGSTLSAEALATC